MSVREKLFELNNIWFEKMLDEAIFEEEHITVIFHTASQDAVNFIEERYGLFFDFEGFDADTGEPVGTKIMPNADGDYIVENVEIGTTHFVYPPLLDTLHNIHYEIDDSRSEFHIDKDNHEFYSLEYREPQVTTQ